MKRRHRRQLLNLCSIALLLFALYLNFVKKDTDTAVAVNQAVSEMPAETASQQTVPAVVAKQPNATTVAALK